MYLYGGAKNQFDLTYGTPGSGYGGIANSSFALGNYEASVANQFPTYEGTGALLPTYESSGGLFATYEASGA